MLADRMSKLLCFTILFLATVHAERKNDISPEITHQSLYSAKSKNIPRTDIYQPNFNQMHRYRDTRSPAVEVLMHLPKHFQNVDSFKSFLGIKPEKLMRNKRKTNDKTLVDVRSYGFAQVPTSDRKKRHNEEGQKRQKREAAVPEPEIVESRSLKIENDPRIDPDKYEQTSMMAGRSESYPETIIEMPAPIRGPVYTSYPIENLEEDTEIDPDDPRKRRNTSANDHDENGRDKRTYMDSDNRESTTAPPFWKRKKDSPPFVTGRDGRAQKTNNNNYTPPQHRSSDNARESHSMKDLDKSVQSNEIPRSNQDSYYASTNRRTYNSRQAENFTPSTPKSVYDTIDYSNRARNQEGRSGYGRNVDSGRDNYERTRQPYENSFSRQYAYSRVYDRYYYPYPYPGEVLGRGIEYYHRTYDPSSGRIVYYANMPEPARNYDPNVRQGDPTGRSFYVNGRTYVYDPYGRSYILPYDYRFADGYGRPLDYMRNGRNNAEPYRDRDRDRYKDDFRNKTYVIFDAEESRPQYPRASYPPPDVNRYGYPAASTQTSYRALPPGPQAPLPPSGGYTPYPYRNQYYPPAPPTPWGNNARPLLGGIDPNYTPRPYNSPDVQLPLNSPSRNLPPTSAYDKLKKT